MNGFGHTWCFNALQCVTAFEFLDITPVHASDCVVQGNPAGCLTSLHLRRPFVYNSFLSEF